jgi:predicted MFS family arabinose efflux permease
VSLGLFALASVGCALAPDVWTLLAFRMLQGAVIAGAVISRAIVRDMRPPREAASLLGTIAMAMAVAPMLAPVLGGVLDQAFGWRASFWAFAVIGASLLALCWTDLGETNAEPSATFGAQLRAYPELVRSRRFWGHALCLTFSIGAFYVFIAGAPPVAGRLFGLSPAQLGALLGSITAGFAVGGFLSGRLAARHPLTTMMIAGRLAGCAGLVAGLILFAAGIEHVAALIGAVMLVGLGNGLTVPSAIAGALSVRPGLAGSAAGLSGALTVGGGAVLTSLTGALVAEAGGAATLLGLMLGSTVLALLAALAVGRIESREGLAEGA